MIQQEKDYLMRQIRSFIEVVNALINGMKEDEKVNYIQLDNLVAHFSRKKFSFFLHSPFHKIIANFSNAPNSNRKIYALATVFHKIASVEKCLNKKKCLLIRYKELMEFHQKKTGQLSLSDFQKLNAIAEIKSGHEDEKIGNNC